MAHPGRRGEARKAQVGDARVERINRDPRRLRGIRKNDRRQLRGLIGPMRAFGLPGADLHVGLVGRENLERRRPKSRAGLHRKRVGLGVVRRRDLEILESALAAVASTGQILGGLLRPCRHRVTRYVNRMRAEQHALRHCRIARQRRKVSRASIARRRHRSLQCRTRRRRIESDAAVGRARDPCARRRGRERMIREQRIDRVEQRESAVEIVHLRPARRRRLAGVVERGAVVLESRNYDAAVSRMRTDRLRLRDADTGVERRPAHSSRVEAIQPAVVAKIKAVARLSDRKRSRADPNAYRRQARATSNWSRS